MNNWEVHQYCKLINKILHQGEKRSTRAGDAYSLFMETITIDIEKEFPLLNGRKMFYKPVLGELAAMFRGPKHIDDFKKFGCNYWDAWGNSQDKVHEHNLAAIGNDIQVGGLELDYGNAWIDFNGVNQLETLIDTLRHNPHDRRMVITGWRPDRLSELSLPCCHLLYQWYVRDNKYLDMVWYQRSVDTMVGLPSDIILAAAWTSILARDCGYTPGRINMVLGDTHIYADHVGPTLEYMRQVNKYYATSHKPITYEVNKVATCANFVPDMIDIFDYEPMPAIKFELNV